MTVVTIPERRDNEYLIYHDTNEMTEEIRCVRVDDHSSDVRLMVNEYNFDLREFELEHPNGRRDMNGLVYRNGVWWFEVKARNAWSAVRIYLNIRPPMNSLMGGTR